MRNRAENNAFILSLCGHKRGPSRSATVSAPPTRLSAQWMKIPIRKLRVHQTGKMSEASATKTVG
jgi:hypothetical protein